jgi:hypothetical protein
MQKNTKRLIVNGLILQPQSQTLTNLKGEVESVLVEEKTFLTAFVATERPLTRDAARFVESTS